MTPTEAAGVLGLPSATASAGEVRAAFRRLSRRAHPDQGGTAERFQELVTARDVLSTAPLPPPPPGPRTRRLTPDDFAGPAARATDDESEIADVLRQFDEALKATKPSFADVRRATRQARRAGADPLASLGHHVTPDGTLILADLPAGAVVVVQPDLTVVVEAGPHRRTFLPKIP